MAYIDTSSNEMVIRSLKKMKADDFLEDILFFHYSRRFFGTEEDKTAYNLKNLLLKETLISDFLKNFGITFVEDEGEISALYKGASINWEEAANRSGSTNANPQRVMKRLGHSGQADTCVNGYMFRLGISEAKNKHYFGPEIITDISDCLGINDIVKTFRENSSLYCYKYKVPISEVIFDKNEGLSDTEKKEWVLKILECRINGTDHASNPILRLPDKNNLPAEYFLDCERIE